MSGQGAFAQQAFANVTQQYTPKPKYFIAAAQHIQMGQVLARSVSNTAEVEFPKNKFELNATIGEDNQWTVS